MAKFKIFEKKLGRGLLPDSFARKFAQASESLRIAEIANMTPSAIEELCMYNQLALPESHSFPKEH